MPFTRIIRRQIFDRSLESEHDRKPARLRITKRKGEIAEGQVVARIARFVRQAGLTYDDWRYVARKVRQKCDLRPAAKPKKLPRVLTADQFRAFYKAVDAAEDVQHALMLRLLFYTGVRVSELCGIEVADVDLENCKIFVNQGKGSKDRYVLFGKSFATALADPHRRPSRRTAGCSRPERCGKFSTRRVQQVVKLYAEQAGVNATPHTFRHQAITWLTKNSGLADAELQLITGHARRETLAIYQHVAVDGHWPTSTRQAMKDVGL